MAGKVRRKLWEEKEDPYYSCWKKYEDCSLPGKVEVEEKVFIARLLVEDCRFARHQGN
jgi:hypothetical protein